MSDIGATKMTIDDNDENDDDQRVSLSLNLSLRPRRLGTSSILLCI